MLLLGGRAGIGKTSLVDVACSRVDELGHEVMRARGSELESGFAFGVVRQLFERRLAGAGKSERAALLAGPAAAAWPLLSGEFAAEPAGDSWFAVLHGLYWLVVNLVHGTARHLRPGRLPPGHGDGPPGDTKAPLSSGCRALGAMTLAWENKVERGSAPPCNCGTRVRE